MAFSVKTKSKKKQVNDEIISLVSGRLSGQCGIIYCSKANDVVDLAYQVSNCKAQIPVSMYFTAPIVTRDREEELHNWLTGKTLVLIATKSAGVGIDKNDVRFVIDADMPNSIEEFFQEGGRAGRDGSSSEVILYYRHEDKAAHVKHIGEIKNSVVRESSMNKLHSILRYANTNKCHVQFIEEYFGESQTTPCNRCLPSIAERVIVTSDAINLLRVCLLVGNIVKKPSPGLTAKVYVGSKGREVTKHK